MSLSLTVGFALVLGCLGLTSCGNLGTGGTLPPDAGAAAETALPEGLDAGLPYQSGGAVVSHVGADGGTASRLYFAVVGDTRPAERDDVAGYPSGVISKIYERIAALDPQPAFVVSTGDYQFASPGGSGEAARAQLALYASARSRYAGPLFPAMGNHECTGATASNCGAGNADGITAPLRAFEDTLLAPIGKPLYFEVDVAASDRTWSAKVLVLAANAWDARQAAWLERAMARATTFTFVVRHEPANVPTAPGVMPSEAIMARHPYTLAICGHKHTYEHPREREIVVGNGGAPLSGSRSYGFAVVDQQPGGSLAVDMVDYASGRPDPAFHFVLTP
jgi:hypothetical protein